MQKYNFSAVRFRNVNVASKMAVYAAVYRPDMINILFLKEVGLFDGSFGVFNKSFCCHFFAVLVFLAKRALSPVSSRITHRSARLPRVSPPVFYCALMQHAKYMAFPVHSFDCLCLDTRSILIHNVPKRHFRMSK